jgi:hypothetical protein
MSFNTLAVANQLVAMLEGLTGIGTVQKGAPVDVPTRVSAYVTMGSQPQTRKHAGSVERWPHYFVNFAYRVEKGGEAAAEEALMALVDGFQAALYADLTLGGTCLDLEVDTGLADEPEYQLRTGKEYREYPIVVKAKQTGSYTVNP